MPHRDRPVKKRTANSLTSDVLDDSNKMKSSPIVNSSLLQSSLGKGEVQSEALVTPGSPEELTSQSGLLVCGGDASVQNKQEEDRTTECLKSDYQQDHPSICDCHNEEQRKSMVLLHSQFIQPFILCQLYTWYLIFVEALSYV